MTTKKMPDPHKPLTSAEFKSMTWMHGIDELPVKAQAAIRHMGRPRKEDPKQPIKIRLDADLVIALRSRGKGWQTRVNAALREAVDSGKL